MRRRFSTWAMAATLLALVGSAQGRPRSLASPTAAEAAPSTAPERAETVLEVSVLHGAREAGEKDGQTVDMPELREGPFARYPSYRLLRRAALPLSRGGKRQLRLPNGRLLEARLEDKLADGSSRLVASINRPDAKDFLPLLEVKARPGQTFIVAGQSYKHGILVLVFKILR